MSQSFLNSGTLVILCPFATMGTQFYNFIVFFLHINSDLVICRENPAKYPSLAKKSTKVYHSLYSSTEQLQVAWWTYMFLKLGLNKEKSLHILPLQSLPLLSLRL